MVILSIEYYKWQEKTDQKMSRANAQTIIFYK